MDKYTVQPDKSLAVACKTETCGIYECFKIHKISTTAPEILPGYSIMWRRKLIVNQ